MSLLHRLTIAGSLIPISLTCACQFGQPTHPSPEIQLISSSSSQWTGIAATPEGRIFVNYPRWSDNVPISVAELIDGKPVPYPNAEMQNWNTTTGTSDQFICVQSVYADDEGHLWVLDPSNPKFQGVVEGGAKILVYELESNELKRVYRIQEPAIKAKSYLNDLRVDSENGVVYITDSGDGAILVMDIESGNVRRLLDDHSSTDAEDITLTIGGKPWLRNGSTPKVNADGIAFDAANDVLYYQALTARTMYQVPASILRDETVTDEQLAANISAVGKTGAADGLIFHKGFVYISALEHSAIKRTTPEGIDEVVVQDERIAWPDSFAHGPDDSIYFTTTRIHEGPNPTGEYQIFRFKP